MIKTKLLFNKELKDYQKGDRCELISIGLFDTTTHTWSYVVVLGTVDTNGSIKMILPHFSNYKVYPVDYTLDNIKSYGEKLKSLEDCKKFIEVYSNRWESGLNDVSL